MTTFASPETSRAPVPQERTVSQDVAAELYPKLVERWESLLPTFTAERLSLSDDKVAIERTMADYVMDVGDTTERLRMHYDSSVSNDTIYDYARSIVDTCDRNARSTVLVRDITEAVQTGRGATKQRWQDLDAMRPSAGHRPGLVHHVARGFASYLSQSSDQGEPRRTTERSFVKALDAVAGDTESSLATLVLQANEFIAQLDHLDEQRRPTTTLPPIDEAVVDRLAKATRQLYRESKGDPSKVAKTTLLRLGQALEKRKSSDPVRSDIIRSATRSLGVAPRREVEKAQAPPIAQPPEIPRLEPEVGSASAVHLPGSGRLKRVSLAALTASIAVGGVSVESAAASPVPTSDSGHSVGNTSSAALNQASANVSSGTIKLKKPTAVAETASSTLETSPPIASDTMTVLATGSATVDPGMAVTAAPTAVDPGAIVSSPNTSPSNAETATTPVINAAAGTPTSNNGAGSVLVQPGDAATGQPEVTATVPPSSSNEVGNSLFIIQPGARAVESVPMEPTGKDSVNYITKTTSSTVTQSPNSAVSPSPETSTAIQSANPPVSTVATVSPEAAVPAEAATNTTMLAVSPATTEPAPTQAANSVESTGGPTATTAANIGAVTMLSNPYASQQVASSNFANQLNDGVTTGASLDTLSNQYVSALQASGATVANLPTLAAQPAEVTTISDPNSSASATAGSLQMLTVNNPSSGETQLLAANTSSAEAGQTYYQMVANGTDQDYAALQGSGAGTSQKASAAKALVLARTLANDPTAMQNEDFAQSVHAVISGPTSDPVFTNYVEGMTPAYADGAATVAAHDQGIMDQTILLVNQLRAASAGYLNDQSGRLSELQGFDANAATQARRSLASYRLAKLSAAAAQKPEDTVNSDRQQAAGNNAGANEGSPSSGENNSSGEITLSPHALDVAAAKAMAKEPGVVGRQGRFMLFMFKEGANSNAALGAVGSMMVESQLDPTRVQDGMGPNSIHMPDSVNAAKGGHGGFGMEQATSWSRQQAILDKAAALHLPEGSEEVQLAVMHDELEAYPGMIDDMNDASLQEATHIWTKRFERPGTPHEAWRKAAAVKAKATFNKYRTKIAAAHTVRKAQHQAAPRSLQTTGTLLHQTVEAFSWDGPHGARHAKKAYINAQAKLLSQNKPGDSESEHFYVSERGADCGNFTGETLRYTGIDPNVPSMGTYNQLPYYLDHPDKYQQVKNEGKDTKLQDGVMYVFIVNKGKGAGGMGHTWFQYGSDVFGKNAYGASYGDEMPFQQSASGYLNDNKTSFDDGRGPYHIFAVK